MRAPARALCSRSVCTYGFEGAVAVRRADRAVGSAPGPADVCRVEPDSRPRRVRAVHLVQQGSVRERLTEPARAISQGTRRVPRGTLHCAYATTSSYQGTSWLPGSRLGADRGGRRYPVSEDSNYWMNPPSDPTRTSPIPSDLRMVELSAALRVAIIFSNDCVIRRFLSGLSASTSEIRTSKIAGRRQS